MIRLHSLQSRTEIPFGILLGCSEPLVVRREGPPHEAKWSEGDRGHDCNQFHDPYGYARCHTHGDYFAEKHRGEFNVYDAVS